MPWGDTKAEWEHYNSFSKMIEEMKKGEHVPALLFFKYERGKAPDSALDQYKSHISKCPECKKTYDFVLRNRR